MAVHSRTRPAARQASLGASYCQIFHLLAPERKSFGRKIGHLSGARYVIVRSQIGKLLGARLVIVLAYPLSHILNCLFLHEAQGGFLVGKYLRGTEARATRVGSTLLGATRERYHVAEF